MAAKTDDDPIIEIKASVVQNVIKRIEDCNGDKESAHGTFMNRCRQVDKRIDAIVDEAERKGVPAKALRMAVKIRAKRQKAQALLDKLEADERALVQDILTANNDAADLPLFAAANARAIATLEDAPAFH